VTSRQASSSIDGAAVNGNSAYLANYTGSTPGAGLVVARYDLTTGAFLYQSAPMAGYFSQNTPMVGPDGTIYQHVQTFVGTTEIDYLYAWADTGTAFVHKWHVPTGRTWWSDYGVGPDGSVYQLGPSNNEIQRLDPATGATLNTSAPIPALGTTPSTRIAIDAQGRVYFTPSGHSTALPTSYFGAYDADLTLRWFVNVPGDNVGGLLLGQNGTLLITGAGSLVRAYRDTTVMTSFCSGDGSGTACPCGNLGAAAHGCANSLGPGGALLQANGNASLTADTLVLSASGMPDAGTLYFQGTTRKAGGLGAPFGDGLRCAAGTIVRIVTKSNVAGSSQYPGAGEVALHIRGQIPIAGGVRTYQALYRSPGTFCTPSTFNLTNGVSFAWTP
jgi:hypothetical protein